jgi:glutamyl-tRNA reductase
VSELLALGMSHKTAPVALRERIALTDTSAPELLAELRASGHIEEAVVLSTCNRTEVYLATSDPVAAETTALGLLGQRSGLRPTEMAEVMYALRNCDVARHLYRVTAGLESMVVGEHEVQGQVKAAYETALESGYTGPLTNRLFRAALTAGKRARSETGIGETRVSVPTVAVDLAREVIGDLDGRQVVVLGAGEMGELTARSLSRQGAVPIFIANRRRERALALARRYGGQVAGFDELPAELEKADIVLAATSSPHHILGAEELELVADARGGRPLLLIDIAVPRDVEPACSVLPGVTLYDIDDLQSTVARNRSVRAAEARRAQEVIDEEIERFARWLGSLEVMPTLNALRGLGSDIVARVLAENENQWESLSDADRERVELVTRTVVQRLLHEPTVRMKRYTGDGVHARLALLRELFGLDDVSTADESDEADVRPLPQRRASGE